MASSTLLNEIASKLAATLAEIESENRQSETRKAALVAKSHKLKGEIDKATEQNIAPTLRAFQDELDHLMSRCLADEAELRELHLTVSRAQLRAVERDAQADAAGGLTASDRQELERLRIEHAQLEETLTEATKTIAALRKKEMVNTGSNADVTTSTESNGGNSKDDSPDLSVYERLAKNELRLREEFAKREKQLQDAQLILCGKLSESEQRFTSLQALLGGYQMQIVETTKKYNDLLQSVKNLGLKHSGNNTNGSDEKLATDSGSSGVSAGGPVRPPSAAGSTCSSSSVSHKSFTVATTAAGSEVKTEPKFSSRNVATASLTVAGPADKSTLNALRTHIGSVSSLSTSPVRVISGSGLSSASIEGEQTTSPITRSTPSCTSTKASTSGTSSGSASRSSKSSADSLNSPRGQLTAPLSANGLNPDLFTLPAEIGPLDTKALAQKIRALLLTHNIGQRIFARYVLCLSQGTVSELLSKPKDWFALTEKGRESYRRMLCWSCDERAINALRDISAGKRVGIRSEVSAATKVDWSQRPPNGPEQVELIRSKLKKSDLYRLASSTPPLSVNDNSKKDNQSSNRLANSEEKVSDKVRIKSVADGAPLASDIYTDIVQKIELDEKALEQRVAEILSNAQKERHVKQERMGPSNAVTTLSAVSSLLSSSTTMTMSHGSLSPVGNQSDITSQLVTSTKWPDQENLQKDKDFVSRIYRKELLELAKSARDSGNLVDYHTYQLELEKIVRIL